MVLNVEIRGYYSNLCLCKDSFLHLNTFGCFRSKAENSEDISSTMKDFFKKGIC